MPNVSSLLKLCVLCDSVVKIFASSAYNLRVLCGLKEAVWPNFANAMVDQCWSSRQASFIIQIKFHKTLCKRAAKLLWSKISQIPIQSSIHPIIHLLIYIFTHLLIYSFNCLYIQQSIFKLKSFKYSINLPLKLRSAIVQV